MNISLASDIASGAGEIVKRKGIRKMTKAATWAFIPKDYYVIDDKGDKQRVLYIDCSAYYPDMKRVNPKYRGKIGMDCYYASHLASHKLVTLSELELIDGYADYHEGNSIDLFNKVFH